MSAQGELLSDILHLLAQPIVAMRATVEFALRKPLDENESKRTLQSCLQLLDRLMDEVALSREIVSLEEEPLRKDCDASPVLREIAEEMEPVAGAGGVTMELKLDSGTLWCSEDALRRALFLMLDTTLAGIPVGGRLQLQLRRDGEGYQLEMRPGAAPGGRRELCRGLLQAAGGSAVQLDEQRSIAAFQSGEVGGARESSRKQIQRAVAKGPSRAAGERKAETGS
jgi:signal transduction histidine kinase